MQGRNQDFLGGLRLQFCIAYEKKKLMTSLIIYAQINRELRNLETVSNLMITNMHNINNSNRFCENDLGIFKLRFMTANFRMTASNKLHVNLSMTTLSMAGPAVAVV